VDNNGSSLVVAPTSSGKTFISFYCMEKVLRESNDSVIVFVSPKKVLVNQVIGDILTRIYKKYPSGSNAKLYGRFTGESKKDILNCQILVTLPDCLEYLFLSETEELIKWRKRVQYAIFDEIQEVSDIKYYKRILSLVNCPIIALSATIKEPEELSNWLSILEKKKPLTKMQKEINIEPNEREVKLIQIFRKVNKIKYFLAHVNEGCNDTEFLEFPFDYPSYYGENVCLKIFNLIKKHASLNYQNQIDSLEPKNFFSKEIDWNLKIIITRDGLDQYQYKIRELLNIIYQEFPQTYQKIENELEIDFKEKLIQKNKNFFEFGIEKKEEIQQAQTLFTLCKKMKKEDMLPCIFFQFSAAKCDDLFLSFVDYLNKLDPNIQEIKAPEYGGGEEENKAKVKSQKKKEVISEIEIDKYKKFKQKNIPKWDQKYYLVLGEYSFINEKSQLDVYEFEETIHNVMKFKNFSTNRFNEALISGLRRGIAIFHEGLPLQYRIAVQKSFSQNRIQVIISDQSLSLGVQLPCKTVIFLGDSYKLSAVPLRQVIGRTGRRGFGNAGNVVFFDFEEERIKSLKNSEIPRLNQKNVFTFPFLLKFDIFSKHDKEFYEEIKWNNIFLSSDKTISSLHESISPLHESALIKIEDLQLRKERENVDVQNISTLISHLYWTDYSVVIFSLLHFSGYFKQLCDQNLPESKICETIMLTLCHIFMREHLRGQFDENICLGTMPEKVREIIDNFDSVLKQNNQEFGVPTIFNKNANNYILRFWRGVSETQLKKENCVEYYWSKLLNFYNILFSLKTYFLSIAIHNDPENVYFTIPKHYLHSKKLNYANKIPNNLKYFGVKKIDENLKQFNPLAYYFCTICDQYVERYLEYKK